MTVQNTTSRAKMGRICGTRKILLNAPSIVTKRSTDVTINPADADCRKTARSSDEVLQSFVHAHARIGHKTAENETLYGLSHP